jgi:integrase
LPKRAIELSHKQVMALRRKVGLHSVGGVAGLALQVKSETSASWILRTVIAGKRPDIGLGSFPEVSLANARANAADIKARIKAAEKIGEVYNPIEERRRLRSKAASERVKAVTFSEVAAEFVKKKADDFGGKGIGKRIQKIERMLEVYAYPTLGQMLTADIELVHIQNVLDPIWKIKTETANRLRLYIEKIIDLATVKGLRTAQNPARWSGNLEQIYTKPSKISPTKHREALSVVELPEFMRKLRSCETLAALVLEFTILTGARPGEARAARWEQIDLTAKTWTIPGGEMKEGKGHVVPLCNALVRMLNSLPRESELVFTGTTGGEISDVSVSDQAKKFAPGITVHGFRSTFKDWAREHTDYADEVSELALAHVGTDATRAAYARDKLVAKRRQMMADYERFCITGPVAAGDVVSIGTKMRG